MSTNIPNRVRGYDRRTLSGDRILGALDEIAEYSDIRGFTDLAVQSGVSSVLDNLLNAGECLLHIRYFPNIVILGD